MPSSQALLALCTGFRVTNCIFNWSLFRFQQTNNGSVYISCALKAVIASTPTDPEHKACSFMNGWHSADDGDDDDLVCMCCDSVCGLSRKAQALPDSGLVSEGNVTIGLILVSNLWFCKMWQ
ncbi:zona pellucida sperm-binding protein 3-like [Misgurnus anguillicaudatus]|uniref:zona pellucida sperm-binding protein 3-like n=1 Tax=Misgurnus anguillicaudatus TaxID=75329 RepID=UPI003CCFA461